MRTSSHVCPACGAPILPGGLRLPPVKQRILTAVQRHREIDAKTLRGIGWGDDPNGGPENRKTLAVHIWQLNQLLKPHGIAVHAGRGAGATYRIHRVAP